MSTIKKSVVCPWCGASNIPGDEQCASCKQDLQQIRAEHVTIGDSFSGDLLLTPVKNMLSPRIPTLTRDDSASSALDIMCESGCDYTIVLDGTDVTGVFTMRDVIHRVLARKLDPRAVKLSDVMTINIETIEADEPVASALHKMSFASIRHLPVLEKGVYCGTLTVDDVMNFLGSKLN